jgi:hypothetical protein
MPDTSTLLQVVSNEPVYDKTEDAQFSSSLKEARGLFVGISEVFRRLMTCKILTDDMSMIMYRSELRSTFDDQKKKLHAVKDSPLKAPSVSSVIKSTSEDEYKTCAGETRLMLCFNADDLIGKISVIDEQEDDTKYRGRIVDHFKDDDVTRLSDPMLRKVRISVNDDKSEEIMSYQKIIDFIESEDDCEKMWKLKAFVGHHGTLLPVHPNNNRLENDKVTFEPLHVIAEDDPVSRATRARDNDLLDKQKWKHFKAFAKRRRRRCFVWLTKPGPGRFGRAKDTCTALKYLATMMIQSGSIQTMETHNGQIQRPWRSNSCTTTECSEDSTTRHMLLRFVKSYKSVS